MHFYTFTNVNVWSSFVVNLFTNQLFVICKCLSFQQLIIFCAFMGSHHCGKKMDWFTRNDFISSEETQRKWLDRNVSNIWLVQTENSPKWAKFVFFLHTLTLQQIIKRMPDWRYFKEKQNTKYGKKMRLWYKNNYLLKSLANTSTWSSGKPTKYISGIYTKLWLRVNLQPWCKTAH